jgi:hypothetical protein
LLEAAGAAVTGTAAVEVRADIAPLLGHLVEILLPNLLYL